MSEAAIKSILSGSAAAALLYISACGCGPVMRALPAPAAAPSPRAEPAKSGKRPGKTPAPEPDPDPAAVFMLTSAPAALLSMMVEDLAAGETAAPLPALQSVDKRVVASDPRWGEGDRVLEFDLLYTGDTPSVFCDYDLLDAAGRRAGLGGSFQLPSDQKTTRSIQVGERVAVVSIRVRPL